MESTKTFDKKEIMIPVGCDVHPWMRSYISVLDHPFFAVTKEDGKFEIKGLPAGEYEIEAFHEKLKTRPTRSPSRTARRPSWTSPSRAESGRTMTFDPGGTGSRSLTVASTLVLIFIGGLVTSTGSGLAVPDWPLSYGMLMPPMVGGVFYEHGHRMVASVVGFLTLVLAVWTARAREPRRACAAWPGRPWPR